MKIICEYCNSQYEDTLTHCPNCGAPNQIRKEDHQPRTIEELQDWYRKMNLPPYETTRFFIGVDYQQPKAFGIYRKPNGNVVVYKNKADGTRAVRYEGKDEAYGVNEILMKLRSEIANQKAISRGRSSNTPVTYTSQNKKNLAAGYFLNNLVSKFFFRQKKLAAGYFRLALIVIAIAMLFQIPKYFGHKGDGYYRYNDTTYYSYGSDWFRYDDEQGWEKTYVSDDFSQSKEDYYEGKSYDSSFEASDWEDSSWYDDYHSSSDSGSDSSWSSSDSWDSGGSDWDSDWKPARINIPKYPR